MILADIFLETSFKFMCVVIGLTASLSFAINITSELSLTPHLDARYSVTPLLLLFNRVLSIAQFMKPFTDLSKANL